MEFFCFIMTVNNFLSSPHPIYKNKQQLGRHKLRKKRKKKRWEWTHRQRNHSWWRQNTVAPSPVAHTMCTHSSRKADVSLIKILLPYYTLRFFVRNLKDNLDNSHVRQRWIDLLFCVTRARHFETPAWRQLIPEIPASNDKLNLLMFF